MLAGDDRRLRDRGMDGDGEFYLHRIDLVANGLEYLLQPPVEGEGAVGAPMAEVAGAQPSIRREGVARGLGLAEVAVHHANATPLRIAEGAFHLIIGAVSKPWN